MVRLFRKFKAGTVFNNPSKSFGVARPRCRSVEIRFPSRLNAMAIDPSKIAINQNMVFTPGEIVFSVKLYRSVEILVVEKDSGVLISETSKRKSLIKHAALIMQKALGINHGLVIDVDNRDEIRHCGLGSSSSLIAAVACAINEIYGNPFPAQELVKYLAQNHAEEVENETDLVQQVQCIGGSAASGMLEGGMMVITGMSQVVKTMYIEPKYQVVLGIPADFQERDAYTLIKEEEKNLSKFMATGKRYGKELAYRVLHEVLPAMNTSDLKPIGDLIFDYRFKMGSIKNCSFTYPAMLAIARELSPLKTGGVAEVLSLSSVGPAFFAITERVSDCVDAFEEAGLRTLTMEIENDRYTVTNLIP